MQNKDALPPRARAVAGVRLPRRSAPLKHGGRHHGMLGRLLVAAVFLGPVLRSGIIARQIQFVPDLTEGQIDAGIGQL